MKSDAHWKKIGLYPHHGICLPLFSLRSKNSCGIGEFLDLIPLIDWCKKLKLDCIQLLPLNDSGSDPSPYNSISSCALDPIYLSLKDLRISPTSFQELTQQQRINRSEVLAKKLVALRTLFSETFSTLSQTPPFQAFLSANPWLPSYAQFKAYKKQFGDIHWIDWPSQPKPPPQEEVDFHIFLQFHCFSQMEAVRAHATKQGVFLKGDIPILLSPDSADVWSHPELFHTYLDAGAPPDAYHAQGQHWGFPLFNWDNIRKSDFAWWKQRLRVVERFFHIYRIDHVVGFFRIWGIPHGKKPIDGSFYPPDPKDWVHQGKEVLEMMLDAISLLPIAEDLGTIPPEVYLVLHELGICGTKVVRWQKNGQSYIPFDQYEPLSLTTFSTHDMDTSELWWKKFPAEAVSFASFMHWSYHPILTQKERFEILRSIHHTPSYFHINLLQEYLALFPELVWLNPEDERINVPGTLLPTNWTYRFRPYLEEFTTHTGLTESLTKILD